MQVSKLTWQADDITEGSDKIYFRIVKETQKETEIRIIIFYFNNLINLFEEKPRVFLSYINLNRWIEAGKKEKIILKHWIIHLSIILYILFYKTLIYFFLFEI